MFSQSQIGLRDESSLASQRVRLHWPLGEVGDFFECVCVCVSV